MPVTKIARSCRVHPRRAVITIAVIAFIVFLDSKFELSKPPVTIPTVFNAPGGNGLPKPTATQPQHVSWVRNPNESIIHYDLNAQASKKVWTASGLNGSKLIEVPATVPGGIYSDLENAGGIFETPIYYRYNDVETRWVGRTHWNFSREFTVFGDLLLKKKLLLICEGLDTVSKVYINDVLVGSGDNMFVRYMYDVKQTLKAGKNTIRVQFESPVLYSENEWNVQSKAYPVYPACVPDEYHGECHANHIRKMQASFSWDWGPSYPSSGIWKNIFIEGYDVGVIRDVMIFMEPSRPAPDETAAAEWEFTAQVWYDSVFTNKTAPSDGININVSVALRTRSKGNPVNVQEEPIVVHKIKIHLGKEDDWTLPHDLVFHVPSEDVKLWWPNGYGEQQLYDAEITYSTSEEVSVRVLQVGFRTIQLVQEPINSTDPEKGLSFYFKVNGIPVYAKGSNSIPIHVLPERATLEMTRWLLESSKEANFNMIRVWGGGIYESEEFYQYADETGIMIWQDFMFACSMYPTGPKYLASVHQEVDTQVKRIQHHPSIAIWAANNENEIALRGGWYGTSSNFELYKKDYIKLYVDTILNYVKELDPSRSCLSSSPTNGKETEKEGWVANNPYSNLYGDVHFYNYYSDGWDWQIYPAARFSSEYGFQAWPSPETLLTGTSKEQDWTWTSAMMNHRQHHPGGQSEILSQIELHLPKPIDPNSAGAFTAMLYMTQITQAMSIKTETEFYRRLKGQLSASGEGHNMGALYWQLNDIWQGASWASIESNGRWKMLHYYAMNFFAPVIISPFDKHENISVHIVSDSMSAFNGTLHVRLFRLDSLIPLMDYKVPIFAEPLSAKEAHLIKKNHTILEQCKNSIDICLLHFSMAGVPDNFLYLKYPTEASSIHDPKLKILSKKSADDQTFIVTLKSKAVAPFVFLSLKSNDILGHFSDNGFNMVDASKVVVFKSQNQMTLTEFQAQLQVSSLHDFVVNSKSNMVRTTQSPRKKTNPSTTKRNKRKRPLL